jgi:hypothetical protein
VSESQFSEGTQRAIAEAVGSVILAAVMGALIASNLIPADYKLLFVA